METEFNTFLVAFRNCVRKLPREEKEPLIAALNAAGFDKRFPTQSELKEIYETLCDYLCE